MKAIVVTDESAGTAGMKLVERPEPDRVLAVLPETSPLIGNEMLERSAPTVEQLYGPDLETGEFAIEASYEGSIPLEEGTLADGSALDEQFKGIGGWVASTLVRLGDLKFAFLPPDPED